MPTFHCLARAQEAEAPPRLTERQIIERLLIDGWGRSSENRRELKAWYEGLDSEKTAAVEWAYALNRLNLNQFREARPVVDRLAAAAPLNWDIRVSQIWLSVFYGEYDQALARMLDLQKDLPKDSGLAPDDQTEIYQRLGRLIGFLRGPAAVKALAEGKLDPTVQKLQQNAPPEDWLALEAERQAVEELFASYRQDQTDEQTRLADEARRRQGVELEQQMDVAQQLQTEFDRGRDERETVIDEGQTQVAALEDQIRSLQSEYNQLSSAAMGLRLDAANFWMNAEQLHAAAAQEQDPYLRAQLSLQANNYSALARDRQLASDARQWNANGVFRQLDSANASYDQTRGLYAERVGQLEQQLTELDRSSRQVAKKIRDLQAEPKTTNAKLAVLGQTAKALTTYSPFPADRFKARFLDAMDLSE